MLKRTLYLAGLLVLLARTQTYSQDRPVLSLSRAWELGMTNYPGFAGNQAEISAAGFQKQLVKTKFLPQVHSQLQHTYGTHAGSTGAFFPLPGIFNVSGGSAGGAPSHTTSGLYGSVLVDWKLFGFGQRTRELQVARLQEGQARTRYSAAQLATQAKISTLYLDIVYNQVTQGWAQTNAARMQQVLALARSLSDAGLKPGADTLFVLSAYRQALAEKNNWQGKARASRIQLTEVIAVPADSFTLAQETYLQAGPAGLMAPATADSSSHPYLQVLQQEVQIARVQGQAARRKALPAFSFLAGLSSRASGLATEGAGTGGLAGSSRADNYLAGLALSWNITGAHQARLESQLARQQALASQARYQTQALQQQTTLRALAAGLQEQQGQLHHARQAVAHAGQAYDLYVTRYESGLISMTELLQLQFLLQQAEKAEIEAYRQYWTQVIRQAELSGDFSLLSNQF